MDRRDDESEDKRGDVDRFWIRRRVKNVGENGIDRETYKRDECQRKNYGDRSVRQMSEKRHDDAPGHEEQQIVQRESVHRYFI
jgi:hypothetical protein